MFFFFGETLVSPKICANPLYAVSAYVLESQLGSKSAMGIFGLEGDLTSPYLIQLGRDHAEVFRRHRSSTSYSEDNCSMYSF